MAFFGPVLRSLTVPPDLDPSLNNLAASNLAFFVTRGTLTFPCAFLYAADPFSVNSARSASSNSNHSTAPLPFRLASLATHGSPGSSRFGGGGERGRRGGMTEE